MRSYYLSAIMIFLASYVNGQEKFEMEVRIKREEVPSPALSFVDQIDFEKRIKWYKEYGISEGSFEAKTKHDKRLYSLEFDQEGRIEDVEILIKRSQLPQELEMMFSKRLMEDFDRFRIKKVQRQYSGGIDQLLALLRNGKTSTRELVVRYELIVIGKSHNESVSYEYLFDDLGKALSRSKIVFRNIDNFEF